MRTQEEIKKQIYGLEAMKEWLPQFSAFGDNNWQTIDAQIRVLKGEDPEDVESELTEDEDDSTLYGDLLEVEDWLLGRTQENLYETR